MQILEKIPSSLEVIPPFISKVIEKIKALGMSEDELFNVRLCLEEALVNAVKHGNKMDSNLFVEVSLKADSDRLVMEIKDEGEGFDFVNIKDPTREENLERTQGRGVFLIKKLMDEVRFEEKGSRIVMIKYLKREAKL